MAGPTIVAKFIADTRQLSDEVDKTTASSGSKVKEFAKDAALAIGGAFAVAKVVDFAKESINAASDLQESASKVGVVFGTAGQGVLDWAKNSATAMGMSQQAALGAAGAYGNLAVSLGLPQDEAANMSKSLVGLAGDFASFNNVPVDEALQALQSGLTGETEPLKKFGVNLNDAAIKAEALSLGLVQSTVDTAALSNAQEASEKAGRKAAEMLKLHGENSVEYKDATRDAEQASAKLATVMEGKVPDSLTAAQKAQATYSAIMKQSGTAQGDFARTSDGLANSQKIAGAKMEDLKAKIGEQLLPAMTAITGWISDKLIPAIESLANWVDDTLMPALEGLGKWMSDNVVTVGLLAAAFAAFTIAVKAHAISTALYNNAVKIATAVQAAWNAVMAANPLFLVIAAIALLVGGLVWAYNNVEWFRDAVNAAWEGIKAAATTIWDWIQTVFGWIVTGITTYVDTVKLVWTTAWDVIKAVVTTLWDWIQTIFGWIVTGVQTYINIVTTVWTTAWDVIKGVVTTLWDWIQTIFKWIKDAIEYALAVISDKFTTAWNAIKDGVTSVWQWVTEKFDAITGAIKSAMDTAVGWVTDAWNRIKDGATSVWSFVTDKFQAIADFFHGLVDKIAGTARAIVDAIKGPINALIGLWNGLAFEIPTIKIPEVDLGPLGKHGGGTLGGFRIDFNDIPYLAAGGVLTAPTMFVGGEAGTEIVAPEAMLRSIVAEESRGGNFTLNMYPRTANASDVAYGFRRLEILAGLP